MNNIKGNSNNTIVEVMFGKSLSVEDLKVINQARLKEFGSTSVIKPVEGGDDWEKPYFLARVNNKIVSFARLHSVVVEFEEEKYEVLGIATMISLEKGKGYGKILMQKMGQYIHEQRKTAIGFCNGEVSGFYESCGLSILKDGKKRFIHFENGDQITSRFPEGDVIYANGDDRFMDKVIQQFDKQVIAYRAPW